MSCNDRINGPCCPDTPYPQVSHESVPSLIDNLVYALYGNITKTVSNGRVIWDIPCDPNNTTEVDNIPREEGEGLLCYLLRLFGNSLDGYGSFLRWGFTGEGQSAFNLTGAYQPDRNAYLAYIDGVVKDPISYTISPSLPRVLTFDFAVPTGSILTVVELSSRAGATGATGIAGTNGLSITGSTGATGQEGLVGATGLSVTGSTGSTGIQGNTGATGVVGLTGATGPSGGPRGATGASGLRGFPGNAGPVGGQRWAYDGGNTNSFSIVGATTSNTLGYLVCIDGVTQDPANYSISGTLLTMSEFVPTGSQIVIISLNGIQGATGVAGSAGPFGGIRWAYDGGNTNSFSIVGNTTNNPIGYSVNIDGVTQDPINYSISGTTLTMSSIVPSGSTIVITSLNGIQGATGSGATGATGSAGLSGATGATGVGLTGATGIGTTGATGLRGATGATGIGATGASGIRGATGIGEVLNVQSFSTNYISFGAKIFYYSPTSVGFAEGSRIRVTADSAYPYDFIEGIAIEVSDQFIVILPDAIEGAGSYSDWQITVAGEFGATGATGIQGSTGPSGGPTGATGIQGATGPSGGPTGATGATGAAAPAGGLRWSSVGDGFRTEFDVTGALSTMATAFLVVIDGVVQDPNNYSIAGSILTISSPVPAGSQIVIVSLNGVRGSTGVAGSAGPFGGIRWAYAGGTSAFSIIGNTTNNPLGYLVCIDGIVQDPINYSISGNTLTMSSIVPVGSQIVIISLNGIQGATGIGSTGATGIVGPQGSTGPSGGPTGATGATGVLPPTNFGNAWAYTGNGIQTVFAITGGLSILSAAYLVHVDGIYQKSTNYTINNVIPRTLTFSTPIPSGSEITIVSLSVA